MYLNFYGFSEKPFDVTPDPKFLYLSRGHIETLSSLTYGIQERRGFIVVVGEVGTGKTTLLNTAMERLDPKTKVAFIFNTDVTFNQLLNMTLAELELSDSKKRLYKPQAIDRLNEFAIQQLPRGGNVALIVDEAHRLSVRSLENLRLLSNLETHKHKLVQIVLCGQPELDKKLSKPSLRQLAQRITIRRNLVALREEESYHYIDHRLAIANYKKTSLFNKKAKTLVWQYSWGVPRKINILCDNALLIGYALKKKRIDGGIMEEAIRDLQWSPVLTPTDLQVSIPESPSGNRRVFHFRPVTAVSLVLTTCIVFGLWLFLWSGWSGMHLPPMFTSAAISRSHFEETNPYRNPSQAADPMQPARHLYTGSDDVQESAGRKENSRHIAEKHSLNQRQVVVGPGDNLMWIIKKAYGRYDEVLLNMVLRENPKILSPDQIFEGQVIRLPEIE
jgi:general secretion pathway protein A